MNSRLRICDEGSRLLYLRVGKPGALQTQELSLEQTTFGHTLERGSSSVLFSPPLFLFFFLELQVIRLVLRPLGFPGGSVVKNPPANAGNVGLTPGSTRSPGRGCGNPLQYSCLENPNGQRSLAGSSPWGHTDSDTTATKTTTPSFLYRQSLIKPNWRGREEKLTDGEFCGVFHIQTRRCRQSVHQKW